jgi:anti-sigma factor RsiW
MTWNCEQSEARLSEYIDQLLDPEERRVFAAHLAGCARCSRLEAEISGLVARMQKLEPVEPPPRLVYKILDQTLGPRKAKEARPAWLRSLFQPRFAMGVATVALSAAIVSQGLGIEWSQVTAADLTPASLYRAADRRVHLVYARGVKFVNDLRVVYEIQSRLQRQPAEAGQPETPPPRPAAPGSSQGPPGNNRERDRNRAEGSPPMILASASKQVPGTSF